MQMIRTLPARKIFQAVFALLLAGALAWFFLLKTPTHHGRSIALLVPDTYTPKSIAIWQQAASEEGLKMEIVTASEFMRPGLNRHHYEGVVLPDTIHKRGNDLLTDSVREYVRNGGKLMLTYDALTLDLNGAYVNEKSRLSDIAGVDYALYQKYGSETIGRGAIVTNQDTIAHLAITPGRFETAKAVQYGEHSYDQWLTTYRYAQLEYPFFLTGQAAANADIKIITANGQVAATEHIFGAGKTLFVNLPLGLLKNGTDGMLLHSFLRYFSDDIIGLPRLLSSPDGIGGLVMNIHIDNAMGIKNLELLTDIGTFEQGPYSIHFTAGPDANQPGDRLGMDAVHNPVTQDWVRKLSAQGHAIGSHGGWVHNYFSTLVSENNGADFEQYLAMNDDALSKIIGKPITEYSSPNGKQPLWVTSWLQEHGVVAYYTTANLGMGPTRMYRNEVLADDGIWSIPVTPIGRIASFEEAMISSVPSETVTKWLDAVTNYVTNNQNIREIYFHPIGITFYVNSMRDWLVTTKAQHASHRFNWYTMTDIANFMSRRELVSWENTDEDGSLRLTASHPASLEDMAWQFSSINCPQPKITRGKGKIEKQAAYWQVIAADVKTLSVSCKP